jgi:hypothetical protein
MKWNMSNVAVLAAVGKHLGHKVSITGSAAHVQAPRS